MMFAVLLALLGLLLGSPAFAQSTVLQQGTIQPFHPAMFINSGVIADGGGAVGDAAAGLAGTQLGELSLQNPHIAYTTPWTFFGAYDAPNTQAYHSFTTSWDANSNLVFDIEANKGATSPGCLLKISNITYGCLGNAGTVVGPVAVPPADDAVIWNSGGLALRDGGPPRIYNVLDTKYGGKCDGSTDDSAAFQAAANAASAAGGGTVFVPTTGHVCLINTGVTLAGGVILRGVGSHGFPGVTATIAQWAASGGSWIQCADLVNVCVTESTHGSGVIGLNFIYSQPIPGVSFTPTTYPYTIKIGGNETITTNNQIIAATHGIQLLYPQGNGGGYGVVIEDNVVSAFNVCFNENFVNDRVTIRHLDCRNLYYVGSSPFSTDAYTEANLTCFDLHYFDNPDWHGGECFEAAVGMKFTDDTTLGNTHALFNANLSSIQFQLIGAAMQVAAGTTHVTGQYTDIHAQSLVAQSATLYQLASDNINMVFSNFWIPFASADVMTMGNGAGGLISIDGGIRITGTAPKFTVNTGATVYTGAVDSNPTLTFAGAGKFQSLIPGNVVSDQGGGFTQLIPGNKTTTAGSLEIYNHSRLRLGFLGFQDGASDANLGLNLDNSAGFAVLGGNGMKVGTPAGSYPGVGKLNAQGLLIGNVAVPATNVQQQQPVDTTGTAAGPVMMGYGSGGAPCSITPRTTGTVFISFIGAIVNTATTNGTVQIYTGTGSAPANQAAVPGGAVARSVALAIGEPAANYRIPFSVQGTATSLALGTAVWFDLALTDISGGTVTLLTVSCIAYEI